MADIFISHSGKDNEAAATIGERIRRERPTWSLFYDKDNIRAGQRWQDRLREELTGPEASLVGDADLRFGAAIEPSISNFSPSRPS